MNDRKAKNSGFKRPGRPEQMQDGKRRNVYIDDASWQLAQQIGNGNASEGIRRALSRKGWAFWPTSLSGFWAEKGKRS